MVCFRGPWSVSFYLCGPPGTGKSAAGAHLWGAENVERITLHQGMAPDDLIGSFVLRAAEGATETVWVDGPAIRAWRRGCVLVLDEIDQHSEECRCVLQAILDDREIARQTLPTGETVKPAQGFAVIATSNVGPSELNPILFDRFDLTLKADVPAPGIVKGLPRGMGKVLERHYADQDTSRFDWTPTITVRRMLAWARLCEIAGNIGHEVAAKLVFGSLAPDVITMVKAQEAPEGGGA